MIDDAVIIVPAYNEAEVISGTLEELFLFAKKVLVIDDGSRDDTALIAKAKGAKAIRLSNNLGYGGALQAGFRYVLRYMDEPFLVSFDADGQHNPAELENLLKPLRDNEADYVIGSRFLAGGGKTAMIRRVGIWFFSFVSSIILRRKITDPTSGFIAMNREVAKVFLSWFFPVDYPDADVVIMLDKMGFRIKEVPSRMRASKRAGSMHSGVLKPIYYLLKMGISIIHFSLRRDFKKIRREIEIVS